MTLPNRILYVEDDEDIRQTVEWLLGDEGYRVTSVGTAEAGLACVKSDTFDLLLTDYRLPGENASWLLHEVEEGGLLRKAQVIVLSAEHQRPADIDEDYVFVRKPVEMDVLLSLIATALPAPLVEPALPVHAGSPAFVFALYVTGASHQGRRAMQSLERIIQRQSHLSIRVVLRDVGCAEEDERLARALEEDRIVVTPTLVRLAPGPKVWIHGDLSKTNVVEEMLGVREPAPPPAAERP